MIIYPPKVVPGDTIAVTAPSSPVPANLAGRLEFVVRWLRQRGYRVIEGECLRGDGHVSASAQARADEFNGFVVDRDVKAIVPPWGGETGIDMVDLIDYAAFAANPTWVVGWSDTSTLLLPLTLRTGIATMHGQNLMDAPNDLPRGTAHFLDALQLRAQEDFTQRDPGVRRRGGYADWEHEPETTDVDLSKPTSWRVLAGPSDIEVRGRLIGGCLDVIAHLAGSPYGDVPAFGEAYSRDGLIVYLENCEMNSYDTARYLHGLRMAGWFEHAKAVLIGRTAGADRPGFTQDDAVLDALGRLDVPVIADVDFGHVPPANVFINGAVATVRMNGARHEITQSLV